MKKFRFPILLILLILASIILFEAKDNIIEPAITDTPESLVDEPAITHTQETLVIEPVITPTQESSVDECAINHVRITTSPVFGIYWDNDSEFIYFSTDTQQSNYYSYNVENGIVEPYENSPASLLSSLPDYFVPIIDSVEFEELDEDDYSLSPSHKNVLFWITSFERDEDAPLESESPPENLESEVYYISEASNSYQYIGKVPGRISIVKWFFDESKLLFETGGITMTETFIWEIDFSNNQIVEFSTVDSNILALSPKENKAIYSSGEQYYLRDIDNSSDTEIKINSVTPPFIWWVNEHSLIYISKPIIQANIPIYSLYLFDLNSLETTILLKNELRLFAIWNGNAVLSPDLEKLVYLENPERGLSMYTLCLGK